jgi:hypothetical protein
MASIVGERYRNASSSDVAALDTKISQAQAEYDDISNKLGACTDGKERWFLYSCKKHQGYTYLELRDMKSQLKDRVEALRKERDRLILSIEKTAEVATTIGTATEQVGKGIGSVTIYGAIALVVIFGVFLVYRKFKK